MLNKLGNIYCSVIIGDVIVPFHTPFDNLVIITSFVNLLINVIVA